MSSPFDTSAKGTSPTSPTSSSSSMSPSSSPNSRSSATTPTTPITPMAPLSPEMVALDKARQQKTLAPKPTVSSLPVVDGKNRLPQNIAHRGFRARFPENSLAAFRGALASGAVALETDVHLSKDKVVVLSHDPTLKRCFGRTEKIADCEWSFLEGLRTTKDPNVGMARLSDLLEFMAEPSRENVWVLVDIKRDDDAEELVTRLADTIKAAPSGIDWSKRIVLGCWDATYMRHAQDKLPGFPIAYIGFSLSYSYELLKYDCVTYFNLLQGILVGPRGARFIREAHAKGRAILVWTVNSEEWMDWSIRHGVEGVITDDPAKFADVRKRWESEEGDDEDEKEDEPVSELTPLKRTEATPPTAHPPNIKSISGLYLRRWTKLYVIIGLLRLLEQVFNNVMRIKYGWEAKRVRTALERP